MLTWQCLKDKFALTSPGQSQIHSELVQARCTEYKGKPLLLGGCVQLKGSRSDSIAAAQAIGAELDLTDKGLGIRSRRYTLLAEDGVVRFLLLLRCHTTSQALSPSSGPPSVAMQCS